MSARPRPVTATFPPPALDAPQRPRSPRSYTLSSPGSSTASLVSILDHESYDSDSARGDAASGDGRDPEPRAARYSDSGLLSDRDNEASRRKGLGSQDRIENRSTSTGGGSRPTRPNFSQRSSSTGRRPSSLDRPQSAPSDRRSIPRKLAPPADTQGDRKSNAHSSKLTVRRNSSSGGGGGGSGGGGSGGVGRESRAELESRGSEGSERRTPWEQWIIAKALEQRRKAETEESERRKREEAEKRAEVEKAERRIKGAETMKKWVEERNEAELRKSREETERKRREEDAKTAKKEEVKARAGKVYEEWVKKKTAADAVKRRAEEEKKKSVKGDKAERERKNTEAFNKWKEAAKSRPKIVTNSYCYSAGKLKEYYDAGAYPTPGYINPKAWQPLEIPPHASDAPVGGSKNLRSVAPKRPSWRPPNYYL